MGKSNGSRYSEEFKHGAIKLVLENKQSIAEACRNLGVSRGTMERWLAAESNSHDAEKVCLRQLEEENCQLRKEKALHAAARRYKPGAGLIHHSDQGVEYTSRDYQALLLQNRIIPSMSRKGTPYDNACAESFFSTIKLEMFYHEHYATRAQAQAAIFEYIEIYYNRRRRNAAIGNIVPAEFRRRFYQQRTV